MYTSVMNIFRKVFLSFLGLTAVTLLITLGLARWSFDQGFLNFIAGLEQQRLTLLGNNLSAAYSHNNNWQLVISTGLERFIDTSTQPMPHSARPGGGFGQPSPLRPRNPKAGAPFHPPQARKENRPPTALFNTQGLWLTGDKPKPHTQEVLSHEIYLNGEKIGELRSWLNDIPQRSLASSFSIQQRYASIAIGLLCLLLAGVASWLLARRLTSPVNSVLHGVERLSRGNYDLKLDTSRSDELGKLMQNLNGLSHILNETRSAKNRWFADISHELRTPLTILIGELDALEAGIRPFGPKQIESLKHEALLLHRLVDDLYQLSLSDVGGLKYHFSQLDISSALENVCSSLQSKAQGKDIIITPNIQANVEGLVDPQRIEQLFINLINNAIIHTNAKGSVQIALSQKGNAVVFEINDTLPSVPFEDCEKLFDPLYRQNASRNRATPGAGLGLTICKNIVNAHRGSIHATQSALGGLCVTVKIPLTKEPA